MMKKIFITILLLIFISFIIAHVPVASAKEDQDWATEQGVGGFWSAATSGQVNQEAWWAKSMLNTMNFIHGVTNGCNKNVDPQCPEEISQGANAILAQASLSIAIIPPASSIEYLADLGKTLGIIPRPAYAQGVGWEGFLPVLPIWRAFRNIAYLCMVVVFVIIGFMIMFRKKLNPQTVITIQEAIPRLVVTLLLITFSYAIAGLVLDLTQLATRIIANTFQATNLVAIPRSGEKPEDRINAIINSNIFRLVGPLTDTSELAAVIGRFPGERTDLWLLQEKIREGISMTMGSLIRIVFSVSCFILMFKIFFALIGPYVQIVLSIIFAPFQLLVGAIPGSENTLGKWVKGLLANAAVFPVTMAMLFLIAIFKSGPSIGLGRPPTSPLSRFFWVPTDWSTKLDRFGITYPTPGIGDWGAAVGELMGFGILFMVPHVTEITKAFIMGKEFPGGEAAIAEMKKRLGKVWPFGTIIGQ